MQQISELSLKPRTFLHRHNNKARLTDANAKTAPKDPISAGLFSNGQISAIIAMHDPNIPAAPTPAKARPKMRTFMLGATPQMREPISKRTTAVMKTILVGVMEITPP